MKLKSLLFNQSKNFSLEFVLSFILKELKGFDF